MQLFGYCVYSKISCDISTLYQLPGATAEKTKTKTHTLGTSERAAPLQLTTHQSETQNLILLACDPLTTEPMKAVSVSATPGTVISLVLGLVFRQTYKNEALTVPSGLANWLDRSPSAKSYVQKTLTRQLLFFVHSRLCPKQVMFPAP